MLQTNSYMETVTQANSERRGASRFPIERVVRIRVLSKKVETSLGRGQTINMSSTGVLFTTDEQLPPGRRVELAISWPAQLNDTCPLKLVARGRVVRVEGTKVAIEIQQYEFRTARNNGFQD
jgi:hypothetical protein